jgi:hypothetical protein
LNGKVAYAISAFLGLIMAWISITQFVIEPLKNRMDLAREQLLREILEIHDATADLDRRIRELERRRP